MSTDPTLTRTPPTTLAGIGASDLTVVDPEPARGLVRRIWRHSVAIISVLTLLAFAATAITTAAVVTLTPHLLPPHTSIEITTMQARQSRVDRLSSLRTPIDPSITALRAGQALQSIVYSGMPSTGRGDVELPVAYPIPKVRPFASLARGPFARAWFEGGAMVEALHGLTQEQRHFLEDAAVSASPTDAGSAEFSLLARAEVIDFINADIHRTLPPDFALGDLPIPQYSRLKGLSYARVARAALEMADGHPDRAEALLREDIGVGFALMNGSTEIENLIGSNMVVLGRVSLVELYEATGRRAQAAAISEKSDPHRRSFAMVQPQATNDQNHSAYGASLIADPSMMRGLRWELLERTVAYETCSDPKQIILGPDAAHVARLAAARRSLVRPGVAGDEILMRLNEEALDRPEDAGLDRYGWAGYTLEQAARMIDFVTRSKRAQSCLPRWIR